jgi:transposase-like protein
VFDAQAELGTIRVPQRKRRSALDAHSTKLFALAGAGASLAELVRWLAKQGIDVERSTVQRWLKKHGVTPSETKQPPKTPRAVRQSIRERIRSKRKWQA